MESNSFTLRENKVEKKSFEKFTVFFLVAAQQNYRPEPMSTTSSSM